MISPENRGETTSYDARLVNCFMEKEPDSETYIYQRPGLDEQSRPPAGNATGRGITNWRGGIYSVFGDRFYVNGVATGAAIDTSNGVYRFSTGTLGATPRLQLGNGVKAYNYDSGGGLVNISDADFPSSFVKGWAYLDGTTYVMRPNAGIQGDDINTPTAWDPLNVIIAQVEPDQGKALAKQLVYVIAFKEWTTEVFYDAANSAGSPLGAVQGAKVDYGCASADSVQDVNGVLLWLATTREAGYRVVALNKLKAEEVSTPAINRLLQNANISTVYSWQIRVGTHTFYVLTIKEENLTLVYDVSQRAWCQWTDKAGNYLPVVASTYSTGYVALLQHESNGRIYTANMTLADDDGELIQVDIYTPNFDGGTKRRKLQNMLEMVADQQAGSLLQVRWNDNDYNSASWSDWKTMDLSQKRPFITNLGTFERRAFNFRHKQRVRMPRITAAELQIDIGTL